MNQKNSQPIDLVDIRQKLSEQNGRRYWRSLDEVAETEEFERHLKQEMPNWAAHIDDPSISRRNFLRLMGASLALAGVTGCTPLTRQPEEKIFPYAEQPEDLVPGKPMYYATAMALGGFATGLLVESHLGRPTKIEGNPDHPASLGATNAINQAAILGLYDPKRSQVPFKDNRISSWSTFTEDLQSVLEAQRSNRGAGLRILTRTITSPTMAHQLEAISEIFPLSEWHQYDPVSRDNAREGAMLAFGEPVQPQYHFDQADVVLSLDADIFVSSPGAIRYARHFVDKRRANLDSDETVTRFYAVESMSTPSGTMADHRLALAPSKIETLTRHLAAALGIDVAVGDGSTAEFEVWLETLVADLQAHSGRSLVVPGDYQSSAVHALAHAMNDVLGNVGTTVTYTDSAEANPINQIESLQRLVDDMANGRVNVLLILDGNPVYDAPVELNFATHLEHVDLRVHQGLYFDETAELCQWHIPITHFLETWGDVRAVDGTATIVQPLIDHLYENHSAHEILAELLGESAEAYDAVQAYWQTQLDGDDFEAAWQTAIHDGVVPNTALPTKTVSLQANLDLPEPATVSGLELNFQPDPTIWDGQYANNGWLEELPKPLTKLTWDNAAIMSPRLAEAQGVSNGDMVTLSYQNRQVDAPVWILPGHAEDCVTIHLGYGHSREGHIGTGVGFNAYALRTSDNLWFGSGLQITPTGDTYKLATTQHHHSMEGRDIIRVKSLADKDDGKADSHGGKYGDLSIYSGEDHEYDGYAWGMVVDLSGCNGCNACVTACQAENNIAIVGKDEVAIGREMHWIRIDRYFEGELDNPAALNQPVVCMQCETAPCEPVCPAAATVHSNEGLNDMVYNRCIGTRYCANNCPYKVRRFNFYQYQDTETPVLKLMHNPDVTVRSRGVMEKCTYCVQRINEARITAKTEGRSIMDGEVQTACQQACPTNAIVFGDINDPNSQVSKLKARQENYGLLPELNTKPRTTYLEKITNPNPEISG